MAPIAIWCNSGVVCLVGSLVTAERQALERQTLQLRTEMDQRLQRMAREGNEPWRVYELRAVVRFEAGKAHYVAHVRDRGAWVKLDDDSVECELEACYSYPSRLPMGAHVALVLLRARMRGVHM